MPVHANTRLWDDAYSLIIESIDSANIKSFPGDGNLISLVGANIYPTSKNPVDKYIYADGSTNISGSGTIPFASLTKATIELSLKTSTSAAGILVELISSGIEQGFLASGQALVFEQLFETAAKSIAVYQQNYVAGANIESINQANNLIEASSTKTYSYNYAASQQAEISHPSVTINAVAQKTWGINFQPVGTGTISTEEHEVDAIGQKHVAISSGDRVVLSLSDKSVDAYFSNQAYTAEAHGELAQSDNNVLHIVLRAGAATKNISIYHNKVLVAESIPSNGIMSMQDMVMTLFSAINDAGSANGLGIRSVNIYGKELSEQEIFRNFHALAF